MCGVIAYTGWQQAAPLLVEGLRGLEYRGYDSAGLATVADGQLHLRRCAGRVEDLARLLLDRPAQGFSGIGHTRWATHGRVSEANAHPQLGGSGDIAVVHNGVIENHRQLRRQLEAKGYVFHSDTDTEVLAHLIADRFDGDLAGTVQHALESVQGACALAVVCAHVPEVIVGARRGSPLAIGIGQGEMSLSSDPGVWPIAVEGVIELEDEQVCVISPGEWQVLNQECRGVHPCLRRPCRRCLSALPRTRTNTPVTLQEIYEQPSVAERVLESYRESGLSGTEPESCWGGNSLPQALFDRVRRVVLVGCGTSFHAALLGKYLIEAFAHLPVEADHASEFRYRDPPVDQHTLVLALTQSGETADTLSALAEARRRECPTLALCNVQGSAACRVADSILLLQAGPEVGVASTKAFTAQILTLTLLALRLGRSRQLTAGQGEAVRHELAQLPEQIDAALDCQEQVCRVAPLLAEARQVLYLGRRYLHPVALEGALKLQELAYVPAHGYAAGEMKHGPLALVDEHTPSVMLMPRGRLFEKLMSNLEEVKARGGPVIAIATEGDEETAARADEVIWMPDVSEYLQPLVAMMPLQLLAFQAALLRGCDVDRPRNLAKSVTVE
jgi:glucosamine--fructose-6-phosphate aminotransferase (isomerizing)